MYYETPRRPYTRVVGTDYTLLFTSCQYNRLLNKEGAFHTVARQIHCRCQQKGLIVRVNRVLMCVILEEWSI